VVPFTPNFLCQIRWINKNDLHLLSIFLSGISFGLEHLTQDQKKMEVR